MREKKPLSDGDNLALTSVFRQLTATLHLDEAKTFLPCVPANQPNLKLLTKKATQDDKETFIRSLQMDKVPVKDAGQWSDCEKADVFSKVTDLYTMIAGRIEEDPEKL